MAGIESLKTKKGEKMSYCINYDFSSKLESEDYTNMSLEALEDDEADIIKTYEFEYFYEEHADLNEDEEDEEDEEERKMKLLEEFRHSSAYYEMRDSLCPIMNFMHILQYTPTYEAISRVNKYARNCVIIYVEKLDTYGIALTGGGMDLSDNIELAYYLTDGESPIKCSQVMSLSGEAEKLLETYRKRQEEKR